MITVQDAVREFGGRWQSPKLFLVVHRDGSYEFCDEWEPGTMLCSRVQFEEEAERQGLETLEGFTAYAQPGFSGDPNDCAFKDAWLPPIGTLCEVIGDESLMYGHGEKGEVIAHVEKTAVIRMSYGLGCFTAQNLRPLKSDRDRWVEAARGEGFPLWAAGRMYDKLTSGELPIPEAK